MTRETLEEELRQEHGEEWMQANKESLDREWETLKDF